MDKTDSKVQEAQSDTASVITMKEYASSEYPSSEPPPAYIKPRSNALRIARLAAFTVIVSSVILGGFILGASWIQANTARNLDLTLNQELLDDLHPSYEHLIASEMLQEQDNAVGQGKPEETEQKPLKTETQKEDKNDEGLVPPPPPQQQEEKQSLDLDEIAAMLMQKNMRGNVNCIVEKKRNEELVDHAPRNLNLPFGLNITTPPRLQHLTGEQMVVICKGDEEEDGREEKEDSTAQQMIFPLPAQLINQLQQVPQVIPIQQLLQQVQQQQQQQAPQQILYQQPPQQQVMYQQPPQQQVMYQQPQQQQVMYQQPQQQQVFYQQPPQQQVVYQQPQQQVYYPQMYQQQPPQPMMEAPQRRPEMRFPVQQEVVPLKEVRLNQERIPMNHVLHHRVPINPMAVQDVPLSQMPLTHLPMKAESLQQEGPVPVHHLVPPQPQEMHVENFNEEEPRFSRPLFRERFSNRFPMGYNQPMPSPANRRPFPPVEMREPRLLRVQRPQESRERLPLFQLPIAEFNDNRAAENREEGDTPFPVEGRLFPFPNADIRPPYPNREDKPDLDLPPFMRGQEPKIIRMIPLSLERRPPPPSSRIRFPDMPDSEEPRERRLPIITEITKIIPIRIEKEEPKDKIQVIPLTRVDQESPIQEIKNIEEIDNKLEKLPERQFPIPINAILDMIFRGIRPLVNARGNSMPIPIDIKIERIENKPMDDATSRPLIEKFEFFEKEDEEDDSEESQEGMADMTTDAPQTVQSQPQPPLQPSTLMLDDIKLEKAPETMEEIMPITAKVEQVEIVEKEEGNTQAIPIPADIQDPEIFKLEEAQEGKGEEMWEPRAFLPNGQGRGARVFPIPQEVREAEIFSVSDARAGKNIEIPMETSMKVEEKPKEEPAEGRQSRVLNLGQPEGEINLFPLSEGRAMKPLPNPQVDPHSFSVREGRSQQLFPVQEEDNKPAEDRPHFVQPRSV